MGLIGVFETLGHVVGKCVATRVGRWLLFQWQTLGVRGFICFTTVSVSHLGVCFLEEVCTVQHNIQRFCILFGSFFHPRPPTGKKSAPLAEDCIDLGKRLLVVCC